MITDKRIDELLMGRVYEPFGLKENPFYIPPRNPLASLVGREQDLDEAIVAIGSMKRGSSTHVAILGVHGIGKTHFLFALEEILQTSKAKELLGYEPLLINGVVDFKQKVLDLTYQPKNNKLLLIDDIDVICNRYPDEMMSLFDMYSGRVIGTWDERFWTELKVKPTFRKPKADVIRVTPLPVSDCIKLIKKRFEYTRLRGSSPSRRVFSEDVVRALSQLSNGNPYRLITRSSELLKFLMETRLSVANSEVFRLFLKTINIQDIDTMKKRFNRLNSNERLILGLISTNIEMNATDLANEVGLSRIWARQILYDLNKLGFLENKPKGRQVVFYIPPDLQFDVSQWLSGSYQQQSLSISAKE